MFLNIFGRNPTKSPNPKKIEWVWDMHRDSAIRVRDANTACIVVEKTESGEKFYILRLGRLNCGCFDIGRFGSKKEAEAALQNTIGAEITILTSSPS
jgi:hypothetical protein